MSFLFKKHPKSHAQVFVDDTSMFASGNDEEQVNDILIPALIDFGKRVDNIQLKGSPKAVIVTSKPNSLAD